MEQNKKFKLVSSKKTRYLLPNILTLGGVCLGISSIKFSIDGNFSLAVTLILFAAILDALDGRIARLIKGTSEFGRELDSLARFNLTKIDNQQEWKNNFFEGIPSPAGGLLILMPLIYELTELSFNFEIKQFTPFLTVLIALLLVSKIPTLSFKKISISSKTTIFLLLAAGLIFISLLFYTFETLLIFGFLYLLSIPASIFVFRTNQKKFSSKISEDDHEDVL